MTLLSSIHIYWGCRLAPKHYKDQPKWAHNLGQPSINCFDNKSKVQPLLHQGCKRLVDSRIDSNPSFQGRNYNNIENLQK